MCNEHRLAGWFLCLCMAIVCGDVLSQDACPPAEENKSYDLECNFPQSSGTGQQQFGIIWVSTGGPSGSGAQCGCNNGSGFCGCGMNDVVKGNFSFKEGKSVLHFINVSRTQSWGNWSCMNSNSKENLTYLVCRWTTFVRAKDPRCTVQTTESVNKRKVIIKCEPEDIYPSAGCQFYRKTDNAGEQTVTTGSSGAITVLTAAKSCTLQVEPSYLGSGQHSFRVDMYPEIFGNDTDKSYGLESSPYTTPSIKLGEPTAKIIECPTIRTSGAIKNNYILEGTTISCTCNRTDDTFFPAPVEWTNNGTVSGSDHLKTLTFVATADQELICKVTNIINQHTEQKKKLQVAYGPSEVQLSIQNLSQDKTLELCGHRDLTITVQCMIPSSTGAAPGATFSIRAEEIVSTSTQPVVSGSTSQMNFIARAGGQSQAFCTANNTAFPNDLSASKNIWINVIEPPSAPLLDVVQNQKHLDSNTDRLTVNIDQATVRCSVTGGYPQPTQWKLSCGKDQTFTDPAKPAEMTLNFTKDMNDQLCYCMVTHQSSCYHDNTTTYRLNVQFAPEIQTFEVAPKVGVTVINKGTQVSFICKAEGNPGPKVSLHKCGQAITDSENYELVWSKTVTCRDTGFYQCKAKANDREAIGRISLNVTCPVQLDNPNSHSQVFGGHVNDSLTVNVSVFGYPEPSDIQLTGDKTEIQKKDVMISVISQEPPDLTISVVFEQLQPEHIQNYTLNITNTEGSLIYQFQLQDQDLVNGNSESDLEIGAIVGGIIAALVVIAIIAVVIIIVRRKEQKGKNEHKTKDQERHSPNTEFTVDISDIYSKSKSQANQEDEVVVDNSDIYASGRDRDAGEVTVDNMDIYNSSKDVGQVTGESSSNPYRTYSEYQPTTTTASAAPKNFKSTKDTASPYEAVQPVASATKPKPLVPNKPKPAPKPKPGDQYSSVNPATKAGTLQIQDEDARNTYASVNKSANSNSALEPPPPAGPDFFPDQSTKPEIPDKNFDADEEKTEKKKKKKKEKKDDEIPMHPAGQGSSFEDNTYANTGFSGDDGNVYANTSGANM